MGQRPPQRDRAGLLDSLLAIYTGSMCPSPKMSLARCYAYFAGKSPVVVEQRQALLNGLGVGGIVVRSDT